MDKNLIKVNQTQLSEVLGITSRHLRNLEEQGLPAEPGRAGGSRQYALPAAVQWWVRYQVRLAAEENGEPDTAKHRLRKLSAEADLAEMERDSQAGKLMDAVAARLAWGNFLRGLQSNLMGFPDRVAPDLDDGMTLAERREVLRRAMIASLQGVVAEAQKAAEGASA